MDVAHITADLAAEHASLATVLGELSADDWSASTRCAGWSVGDQVAHLAYFDHTAGLAITDPDAFAQLVAETISVFNDGAEALDVATIGSFRRQSMTEVIDEWTANSSSLIQAAGTLGNKDRVLWYGPPMGARSFLSARLMETWVHGDDLIAAIGRTRPPSDRIRHVVQLGVNTRGWSYQQRGQAVPEEPVRITLDAPSGATWTYGPDDAPESLSGSALEFCEVVTQRRHLDDTELRTTSLAREWLLIAQAFAGPATEGPGPTDAR